METITLTITLTTAKGIEVEMDFDNPLHTLRMQVEYDLKSKEESLIERTKRIDRIMSNLRESVDRGLHINSMGELQSMGSQFDIECAEREALAKQLRQIDHLIEKQLAN